jgi:hypothetical protein
VSNPSALWIETASLTWQPVFKVKGTVEQEEGPSHTSISFQSASYFLYSTPSFGSPCVESILKSHLLWRVLEKYKVMNSLCRFFLENQLNNFREFLNHFHFFSQMFMQQYSTNLTRLIHWLQQDKVCHSLYSPESPDCRLKTKIPMLKYHPLMPFRGWILLSDLQSLEKWWKWNLYTDWFFHKNSSATENYFLCQGTKKQLLCKFSQN